MMKIMMMVLMRFVDGSWSSVNGIKRRERIALSSTVHHAAVAV